MTAVHCVAVVGGGPMCTYALAHLAAVLPDAPPAAPVRIVVFERGGRAGAGEVHSDAQPPTGYLNRVAGQIAFAPDESSDPPRTLLPVELRPTFQEWCADRYARTGRPDFDVRPYDVPKRYVHGLALRELFLRYVDRLQGVAGVTVELYDAEVTGVTRGAGPSCAGGERFVLRSADGAELTADEVLFVTGHSWNTPAPGSEEERLAAHEGYVPTPYPLAGRLDERTVPPGRPVAVRGLGLTAIDVFLQLTEGRGGVFVPDADAAPHGLRYVPAGREPSVVVAVSPSGVPVSGRPLNDKVSDPGLEHTGVFFTVDAVRALRATVGVPLPDGRRPLDFDLHLFPLVCLEMAWVHHRTLRGDRGVRPLRGAVTAAYRDFLAGRGPWGEEGADALVRAFEAPLAAEGSTAAGRFEWRALLDPLPAGSARRGDDGADWARRSAEFLRRDHRDALEGNLRNAVKAACDGVWRDLRAVFGEAVDFGGLTPDSHRRFVRTHLRHYNRLSNGAGLEPMRKVLALLDAGVLDLSVGPRPEVRPAGDGARGFTVTGGLTGVVRAVDAVVEGRVHPFDPRRDVLPLYRSLLDAGLVRLWRNQGPGAEDFVPGALDLTDRFHPVLPDGSSEPRLTFLGAPAEGLRVFQQSAARPHSNSSVLAVAADWAEEAARRMPRRTNPPMPTRQPAAALFPTPAAAAPPLAEPALTAPVPTASAPTPPNPTAPVPAAPALAEPAPTARVPAAQPLAAQPLAAALPDAPTLPSPTPTPSTPAPPNPTASPPAAPSQTLPAPAPAPLPLAARTPAAPPPTTPQPATPAPAAQALPATAPTAPAPTAPTPTRPNPTAPPRPAAPAAASQTLAAPPTPAPAPQPLAAPPPAASPPTAPPPAAPPAPPTFAAPAPAAPRLPASAVAAVPNSEGWTTR